MGGDNAKLYANANQMLSDALCACCSVPDATRVPVLTLRLPAVRCAANVRTVAAYGLSRDMVGLYTLAQEGPGEQLRKRSNINGAAFGFGQGMFVFLCARPAASPPGHVLRLSRADAPVSGRRRARVLVRRLAG